MVTYNISIYFIGCKPLNFVKMESGDEKRNQELETTEVSVTIWTHIKCVLTKNEQFGKEGDVVNVCKIYCQYQG